MHVRITINIISQVHILVICKDFNFIFFTKLSNVSEMSPLGRSMTGVRCKNNKVTCTESRYVSEKFPHSINLDSIKSRPLRHVKPLVQN